MPGKIFPNLLFLVLWLPSFPAAGTEIFSAVFGEDQHFWSTGPDSGREAKAVVLPVFPLEYAESKPCDSCHWASENGLIFAMENYTLKMARALAPHIQSELIHPESELVMSGRLTFNTQTSSLSFPWGEIFAGYTEPIIYRPSDRFTPPEVKEQLSRIGGQLGAQYLLTVQNLRMHVWPTRSNDHQGRFSLKFYLVFWNVAGSFPEWMVFFKTDQSGDLDTPVDQYLEKSLNEYLSQLPSALKNHRSKEPR